MRVHALFVLLVAVPRLFAGAPTVSTNPQTGLLSWKVDQSGFGLELMQLNPDFVRAVYGNRNFPPEAVNEIASWCVFGSVARNTSDKQVAYRVADWRYLTPDGREHALKTKSEWVAEWRAMGIPYAWSLLPDDQVFEVGDWNQGFTTIKLPRDSEFDLLYSWSLDGEPHRGHIAKMRCAPETLPVETNTDE